MSLNLKSIIKSLNRDDFSSIDAFKKAAYNAGFSKDAVTSALNEIKNLGLNGSVLSNAFGGNLYASNVVI